MSGTDPGREQGGAAMDGEAVPDWSGGIGSDGSGEDEGGDESESGGDSEPGASTTRRVLVDVGHPAQVHLFRHLLGELDRRGHETLVTSREKEVTVDLLDAYDIDHVPLTTRGASFPGLVWELLVREWRLLRVARRFDPDVLVSRLGPAPLHVSRLVGCRNVVVSDTRVDSRAMRAVQHAATLPFADTVCAPPALDLPVSAGERRNLGFQELSYLHPRYFQPEPERLVEHGIDPDAPYFVVRLAGWDAYHDVGHRGLSPDATRRLVSFLSDHGVVYVSAEGNGPAGAESPVPPGLSARPLPTPPEHVHHALYHANLYVGDSGTMSTEAAVLGTPAVRTNSMVGDDDEPIFRTLEERYGLLRSFADEAEAVEAVERLVRADRDRTHWRRKRARLIEEQPDVTERLVGIVLEAAATTQG